MNNTSSGWKYLDHLKFVFNHIDLGHFINNEINLNTFKTLFGSFVRKRVLKKKKRCCLEFFKNVCLFQGRQPYLSNVVEFQSSKLKLLARTNTLALNYTKIQRSDVTALNAKRVLINIHLNKDYFTSSRVLFVRAFLFVLQLFYVFRSISV